MALVFVVRRSYSTGQGVAYTVWVLLHSQSRDQLNVTRNVTPPIEKASYSHKAAAVDNIYSENVTNDLILQR